MCQRAKPAKATLLATGVWPSIDAIYCLAAEAASSFKYVSISNDRMMAFTLNSATLQIDLITYAVDAWQRRRWWWWHQQHVMQWWSRISCSSILWHSELPELCTLIPFLPVNINPRNTMNFPFFKFRQYGTKTWLYLERD